MMSYMYLFLEISLGQISFFRFMQIIFNLSYSSSLIWIPQKNSLVDCLPGKLRTEFSFMITKNPLTLHYQTQLYL